MKKFRTIASILGIIKLTVLMAVIMCVFTGCKKEDDDFVPVSSISGVPATVEVNQPLTLEATVSPSTATNRAITWTVKDAGSTGASISGGNILTATSAGTVTVTATVANAATKNKPFTQDFSITVTDSFVPVSNISDVPAETEANSPLTLAATVTPADATNRTIVWSVKNAGTTGATITGGNILNTTGKGTVIVTATIANGASRNTPFTKDFNITVKSDVILVRIALANMPYTYLYEDGSSSYSYGMGITFLGVYNRYQYPAIKDTFKLKKVGESGDKIYYTIYSDGEGTGWGGGGYLTDATELVFNSDGSIKNLKYAYARYARLTFEAEQSKNSVFAFQCVEPGNANFVIETASGGYVRIYNGVPIVSVLEMEWMVYATVFNLEYVAE